MSRILVFGSDNRRAGEVDGICSRGWSVEGARSVTGGGSTSVKLSTSLAANAILQLGRMVLVDHPRLDQWAGMIDTPWAALAPISVTLYNASYIFKLRAPDQPLVLKGTTYDIVSQIIGLMNEQEETYLRIGDDSPDSNYREFTLDQRQFWDQLTALLQSSGREMFVRPEINGDQLFLMVDVKERIGEDTGFLLHDGQNANMRVREAKVDGQIWNRVIGIGTQRTSRIVTDAQLDAISIAQYRLRSRIERSQAATLENLQESTRIALQNDAQPHITLRADALDVGETFEALHPGNGVIVHTSRVVLPGGVRGWRGSARILQMALNEDDNTVGMTLEAPLA